MCQSIPQGGLRCSSHALEALNKARGLDDPKKIILAEDDYYCSPSGLAELKTSGDPRYDAYLTMREKRITINKESYTSTQSLLNNRKQERFKDMQETMEKQERDYAMAENHIVGLFAPRATFSYNGKEFTSVVSAKPTVSKGGGEGKTDIYIKAVDVNGHEEEIKISYKKENADSYENWVSAQRAEATFGPAWKEIISQSIQTNKEAFENAPKYARKKQKTRRGGSYVVGYAFDIRSEARNLSTPLTALTDQQEKEIYSGATLPAVKRDSIVNGVVVKDSGVATHMLVSDTSHTAQDAIDSLVSMDDYVKDHKGQLYMAYKAINYRFTEDKADSARPLAVTVHWDKDEHGKMVHTIDYDNPLSSNSSEALISIRDVIRKKVVKSETVADIL